MSVPEPTVVGEEAGAPPGRAGEPLHLIPDLHLIQGLLERNSQSE